MNFPKLTGTRVITLGLLAGAVFAAGFAPKGPITPDLLITGLAAFEDGTPVEAPVLSFSVTAVGNELFSHARGCAPVQGQRQGWLRKELSSNFGGAYRLEISSEDFLSTDSSRCSSSGGTVEAIDLLRLEVSIPTDFKVCAAFCRANRPSHMSSCLSECTTGNRRLLGTKVVLREELASRKMPLGRHMSGINEIAVVFDHYSAAAQN
ncbi:MAG: hypothetical protein HY074_15460 [Deltaproteobacteria bacterium]|nr:hypothetical protein [Deltaproteobacteria bacterium]